MFLLVRLAISHPPQKRRNFSPHHAGRDILEKASRVGFCPELPTLNHSTRFTHFTKHLHSHLFRAVCLVPREKRIRSVRPLERHGTSPRYYCPEPDDNSACAELREAFLFLQRHWLDVGFIKFYRTRACLRLSRNFFLKKSCENPGTRIFPPSRSMELNAAKRSEISFAAA